jgi:hypothetical protein
MTNLDVVKLNKPDHIDEMVTGLENIIARLREGEFETVMVMAFMPDGSWLTRELGRKHNRLETVGILEILKLDVMNATDLGHDDS